MKQLKDIYLDFIVNHVLFIRANWYRFSRWISPSPLNETWIIGALFFIVLLGGTSCKKFVQIAPGPNLITSEQVFADSADATSAVLGLYLSMMSYSTDLSATNGLMTIYSGLAADEIYPTQGFQDESSIYTNTVLPTNQSIYSLWAQQYAIIYEANACISGIPASSKISQATQNQLVGEAKLVRAFMYFNLVNLYGPVPLVTTTDYSTNASLPRSSIDSVYKEIIFDLTDAQNLMTAAYPSAGRARPNRFTATALLAKAYLYTQQWANAEAAATTVINSGLYSLTELNSVFLTGSNEAIWQITPVQSGYETAEGLYFVPYTTDVLPNYIVDSFLLKEFEPGDMRKVDWLDSNFVGGTAYYYPYKYKLGYDQNSSPLESYMIFRLGEQYLIRAEARAQLNESSALNDLNTIRARAQLTPLAPASQTDLLADIYHERQIELFCEWGNRWLDLKRTGLITSVMPGICLDKGGTWTNNAQLFPIYTTELQSDPTLYQNPGY